MVLWTPFTWDCGANGVGDAVHKTNQSVLAEVGQLSKSEHVSCVLGVEEAPHLIPHG